MREVMVFFPQLEDQGFDWDSEMLRQRLLEIDQLQVDAIAVVKGVDPVNLVLKVDLVVVDNPCIGSARIGDDIDILEFQAGLLQTESDCSKRNTGGELDAVESLLFGGSHQFPVHEDGSRSVGMEEIETQDRIHII